MAGEVRYYTVEDAARMLRLSPERVREMLEDGELEGRRTGDTGGWRVPLRGNFGTAPPPADVPPAPPPTETTAEPIAGTQEAADEPPPEPTTEPPSAPSGHKELPEETAEPDLPPATVEQTRQPAELARGEDAATNREPTSESGWVTTQQAAKALGISARTVRWHIERGNLEAKFEGEGVERRWSVSVDSLLAFRDTLQSAALSARGNRAPFVGAEIAAESPGNAIRELADRLVEEARRAEAASVRLELSERAHSSLEAELSEERRRREVAERELGHAQRERAELRRMLEARQAPETPSELPAPPAPQEARGVAMRTPETPAQGFGTDAAGGGPQRQASPRWWARRFPWRRS